MLRIFSGGGVRSFASFLFIFSWPKQHLLLGSAYKNELNLLILRTMNRKFYSTNKDANIPLLRRKEAILRTMTTKFKLLIKMPTLLFFGGKEAMLRTMTTKLNY